MASLKQQLKQKLIDRQHLQYERDLASQEETYDSWIKTQEKKLKPVSPVPRLNIRQLSNDLFCQDMTSLSKYTTHDILLLTLCEGTVNKIAAPLILSEFASNPNTVLIYGDEDTMTDTVRSNPWFKPDWSPDRFLSGFYFGALVAVRADALKQAYLSCQKEEVLKAALDRLPNAEKLYFLLFEMLKMQGGFVKRPVGQSPAVCHIPQILYHSQKSSYEQIKDLRLPESSLRKWNDQLGIPDMLDSALLSVIIPSKDNPDVLFRCVDSLLEKTVPACSFEIVIIDNGSNDVNRERISQKVNSLNQSGNQGKETDGAFRGCRYLYQPMPFNFSRMCNLGAADAKGQLLLFLNDDVEIIQEDWMRLMAEKALLPYAGAVGAKLLYPNSDTIQHAGVTNIRLGPAHKLQYLSDKDVHYFGMNRGVHDMLAVTGACLMTRREVFEQPGGFCEEIAVAFNDVDLCYHFYERGYYNIARNDVIFYHHESLSRGFDGETEEKQQRHIREKETLYKRHPDIYGRDPFYHPYLATDVLESEYYPVFHYYSSLDKVLDMICSPAKPATLRAKLAREDKCLSLGIEIATDICKWQYNAAPQNGNAQMSPEYFDYYFQGFAFVIGSDNACYERKLLLKNRDRRKVWALPVENQRRPDIREQLKDQTNVDLTGFAAKLHSTELPPGVYQIGMLAKDKCSRQRLVNWSSWTIEITERV